MRLKEWVQLNKKPYCANIFTTNGIKTRRRGNIPKSWLDLEVEDEIDEGDFVDLWLR